MIPTDWTFDSAVTWFVLGFCIAAGWHLGAWVGRTVANAIEWVGRKLSGK